MALSPDGRRLAFVVGGSKLLVIPSEGGDPQQLLSLEEQYVAHWAGASALVWTPEGSHILFGTVAREWSNDATVEVWRISAAGGEPEPIGITANRLRDLRDSSPTLSARASPTV
jgi:Tol biopolymer transport system component